MLHNIRNFIYKLRFSYYLYSQFSYFLFSIFYNIIFFLRLALILFFCEEKLTFQLIFADLKALKHYASICNLFVKHLRCILTIKMNNLTGENEETIENTSDFVESYVYYDSQRKVSVRLSQLFSVDLIVILSE
jgi:hypothetical protein